MKRTLALLLVLATLLCLFPVAASAEAAAPAAERENGSYLDLYVKKGLVALYDAYSGVAADAFEATAKWAPVDFYGKEGYDAYADLSVSTADLMAGVNMRWKWENGYLVKSSHTDTPSQATGHRDDNYSFIRLNKLGEQLLADANAQLTVQQVYQLLGGITKDIYLSTPKVENGVVVNASTITAYPYTYSGGFKIGDLDSSYDYHTWVYDGKLTQGGVWRASFTGDSYDDSLYFLGEYYNVLQGADASNASRWVRMGETGIVEETVTRTSSTAYNVHFRNGLTYTNGTVSTDYRCTVDALGSTEISLQRGIRARVYSIRIYNTVLSDDENNQNHLADLLGFYGINVADILAFDAEELGALASATADLSIAKDSSEYAQKRAALRSVVDDYVDIFGGATGDSSGGASTQDHIALYVKDGLAALFDGHSTTEDTREITEIVPVDLFGKKGYNDYVNPSRYTADIAGGTWDVLRWYNYDGSIHCDYHPSTGYGDRSRTEYQEYVDLSDLGALIGTTYTVQEVFTQLIPGPGELPVLSNGALSYPIGNTAGSRFDGSEKFGALTLSTTFKTEITDAANRTGTWEGWNGGFCVPFIALATGGTYRGHHIYAGDAYGSPLQSSVSFGGTRYQGYHVATSYTTVERSVMRMGFTSEDDGTYTSSFAIHYANTPLYRSGNYLWINHTRPFSYTSANQAEHTDTTLHIMANGGAAYHSVRIYTKALSDAELTQNHMADLVGYYQLNASDIMLLSTEELAALADEMKEYDIVYDKTSMKYANTKVALRRLVSSYTGAGETTHSSVVSSLGLNYRTSGDFGVRTLYLVDKSAVASLEAQGYTVIYGAVLGVLSDGSSMINESVESLTVKVENGTVSIATGKGVLAASNAGLSYLTADEDSFVMTITFKEDGSNSDMYDATLIYRGFTAIVDERGFAEIFYEDLSIAANPELNTPSLRAVYTQALSDPFLSPEERAYMEQIADTTIKPASSLYVTEGLTVLLTSYEKASTSFETISSNQLRWYNGVSGGEDYATLIGTGWTQKTDGVGIVKNIQTDYNAPNSTTSLYRSKEDYAITLPAEMLPSGSYTVEYVANPVGVTDYSGERAVIADRYNLYNENTLAIGPLRTFMFDGAKTGSKLFQKRWIYGTGDTPYADAIEAGTVSGANGNLPGYSASDYTWGSLGLDEVITTTITLDTSSGNHEYDFYTNQTKNGSAVISAANVISANTDPRFRLMGHTAGTVFAIRVYNRVLSEAEIAQNHFADLVYYYGLDVSIVRSTLNAMGDMTLITSAFKDVGFDLSKEEAKTLFEERITKVWLTYAGFDADSENLLLHFDVNDATVRSLISSGAVVEIGALINVGKNEAPSMSDGYDHKIVAYNSMTGKNSSFYIDADTFAAPLSYENFTKEEMLRSVLAQGYVKISFVGGKTVTYHLDLEGVSPSNLFEAYKTLLESGAVDEHATLKALLEQRIDTCYDTVYVYLDASAASGGNGSAARPFNRFDDAFAAAKAILRSVNAPTHVILSAKDGHYTVSSKQMLTGEDMPYPMCDLTILSENGGAVLSSLVSMEGGFISQGNNIYTYQFTRDASGNYPLFRYLYVDGVRADIAYNGSKYAVTETPTLTGVDRPFEGVWATAIDQAKAGTLTFTSAVPSHYAASTDLKNLYEYYRPIAIAYAEIVAIYEGLNHTSKNFESSATALLNAQATKSSNTSYQEAFALYKERYLGRYDAECDARYYGPRASGYKPNYTYLESEAEGIREYHYQQARHLIYWNAYVLGNDNISLYELPMDMKPGSDGKSLGKYYLPATLLGDEIINIVRNKGSYMYKTALRGYGIEINFTFQYMQNTHDLLGIDLNDYYVAEDGSVHYACYLDKYAWMQVPAGGNGPFSTKDHLVYAANHLSFLDKEGEFYYDKANGTLYYYSESGVSGKSFARPTSDYLLYFTDVKNVSIEGFGFTGTDDYFMTQYGHNGSLGAGDHDHPGGYYAGGFPDRSAIFMGDAQNVTISDCRFYELGCEGITARGWLTDITVEGCSFEHIGASAIRFGENIRATAESNGKKPWIDGEEGNTRIDILNNYLKDISTEYLAPAIQLTTAYNCRVQYNTIDDCAYSGISVGWQWEYPVGTLYRNVEGTDISYNYISGFMNESHDGGAIYVAGPNAAKDNTALTNELHHNYILYSLDTGDGLGSFAAGLYFDGATSSYHVYDNVVVASAYGAASGETNYAAYGITAADAQRLAATRKGATLIYLQHITNQEVHNILLEDNIVINVRATTTSAKRTEVYNSYLQNASGRNVKDNGSTVYVNGATVSAAASATITEAGATGHKGVPSDITDNAY